MMAITGSAGRTSRAKPASRPKAKGTLLDYSDDKARARIRKKVPEPEFVRFLGRQKKARILVLSPGSSLEPEHAAAESFRVTATDPDYEVIKGAAGKSIDYVYSDFWSFSARQKKDSFDIIADIGFLASLPKARRKKFIKEAAKMMGYGGILFIMLASSQDQFCRSHCPKRLWTKIDDSYIRFFPKPEAERLLQSGGFETISYFSINREEDALPEPDAKKLGARKSDAKSPDPHPAPASQDVRKQKRSYHVFYSVQKIKKW